VQDIGGGVPRQAIDWSVSLGTGNVAPNMYPAKFIFNLNSNPDCANDYAVFGLNVAGVTGGQANLVGINQLYSGTAPTGLCGTTPHVNWAYNGTAAAGGRVLTSPQISPNGDKIAYVESTAGASIFHVLTWKAGEGTSATAAASPTAMGTCTASTSCLVSVAYSVGSTTTLASPWVDYASDKAYVASDNGNIYRLSCAFTCALNTAPTVDWTFALPVAGTGGASALPNGPVTDRSTTNSPATTPSPAAASRPCSTSQTPSSASRARPAGPPATPTSTRSGTIRRSRRSPDGAPRGV